MSDSFRLALEGRSGRARAATFTTPHGPVRTPSFMVVGTNAAVRGLAPEQVRAAGTQVVLANTYHLALRPGEGLVAKMGGLHSFMGWDGPILTDSGGFQVFSLPDKKKKLSDEGVVFRNEVDGKEMNLTPERSMQIQEQLGADIIMAFDECTPYPATEKLAAQGVRRTIDWAQRCQEAHTRKDQALFAIVQGSTFRGLRESCAASLAALDFPGYAIGGVSVGEGHELLCEITEYAAPLLPEDKPRYLMGVGLPEDLVAAIGYGIDLFDCVIPTRYARSATAFTSRGRIRLTHRRYRRDKYPIDLSCDCTTCAAGVSRAYMNHLFNTNEILGAVYTAVHNVRFYQRLMEGARDAILAGRYDAWRKEFLENYQQQQRGQDAG